MPGQPLVLPVLPPVPGTQPPFWQTAPANGAVPGQPLVFPVLPVLSPVPGTQPPFWQTAPANGAVPGQPLVFPVLPVLPPVPGTQPPFWQTAPANGAVPGQPPVFPVLPVPPPDDGGGSQPPLTHVQPEPGDGVLQPVAGGGVVVPPPVPPAVPRAELPAPFVLVVTNKWEETELLFASQALNVASQAGVLELAATSGKYVPFAGTGELITTVLETGLPLELSSTATAA